jgi:hypothetical protein
MEKTLDFFTWLEGLSVSQSILTSIWFHPYLLVGHSIGMGVVVGIIFMLDLRVLGYAPAIPIRVFERCILLGWAGFALNAVTGVLMFMAYAHVLATNWTFQLKMLCIVAAGVSIWLLWRSLRQARAASEARTQAGADIQFSHTAKWLAVASMLFWLGAITTGRLIAYTVPEGV